MTGVCIYAFTSSLGRSRRDSEARYVGAKIDAEMKSILVCRGNV